MHGTLDPRLDTRANICLSIMKFLFVLFIWIFVSSSAKTTKNHLELVTSEKSEETSTSASNESESEETFTDNWLIVPLDHFNLFDNRTWNMRYLINDEFFQKGSPLFIEIGGEWTISGGSISSGQLYELAKVHHGMLVATEHRYYGKSLPFSTDFSTENLQYLQIEQALEDLAYFIENFKTSIPGLNHSTVVIHGCSYPGMLATWLRLRFPHLVDISYASSAPLGVGLDYPEFYEVINDVYANISGKCIESIRQGFNQTEKMLKNETGRQTIRDALEDWECGNVTEMNSIQIMSTMLAVLNTQYDPINYEELTCAFLKQTEEIEPYQRLTKLIVLKSQDVPEYCNQEDLTEEGERNNIAWSYQTCTEMGTFQTLSRENSRHPFAMDSTVEESVEECVNDFGEMVTEEVLVNGIERVTRRYGGKTPKVTKVVTVQGTKDPWRYLADQKNYTKEAPVFLVEGAHCADVTETDDDPEELIEIRKKIQSIISSWIKEIS